MGKYYDPDTDQYIEYDEWKQYDESMVESIMEDCGCEQPQDLTPIMRYMQLKAEGREDEAQQLAEAVPLLIPIAGQLGRMALQKALPFVIRQIAGKGAGNVAKKLAQRGVKKTGKIMKRALRSKKNKAKAGGAVAGNVAMRGDYGPDMDTDVSMDYLTKMTSSADQGKPAITEAGTDFQAIGRKLEDMSMDYKTHKADVDNLTKQLGLKDPMETLNYLGRVGEHLEHYGVAGGFGAKSLDQLAQKAMLDKDMTLTIVKMGNAKLKKEGDVDGSRYQDAKPDNSEPNDYVENFVKNIRAQLEGKYKNDAQRKAVHASKAEKK
jgi:Holliday junction resolvase RusA-like endonuclease